VNKVEKLSNLEDAVSLALAADEFLLEPLQTFCGSEIERMVTVETVWQTLNSINHIPKVAEGCVQVSFKIKFISFISQFNLIKKPK